MIDKIFLVLICGLPFSNLLFKKLDIWHAQGHFFQLELLALFCCSFIEKPKLIQNINKPLAFFTFWAGLVTAYNWLNVISLTNNYPIKIFLPFFNFLCFLIFYKLSLEYLDSKKIGQILAYFKYSILIFLFYCVLQLCGLDEFFTGLSGHDELVGTLGNTSHLAGYLSICQPIFFRKNRLDILILILLWIIILLTKSASGLITGIAVLLFWLLMKKKYIYVGIIGGMVFLIGIFLFFHSTFFNFNHRLEIWEILLDKFQIKPITGYGLGIMNVWQLRPQTSVWRHAHQEYYQIAIELGIIGLGLVLWCIWDYFKRFKKLKTDLTITLASIFFGFCILSLFTFSAHLWVISGLAIAGYSWFFVIENEVKNGCDNT